MDMLHCYNKGVREQFPQARIVYDRYHLMVKTVLDLLAAGVSEKAILEGLPRSGS
jgi:hypothetical protein